MFKIVKYIFIKIIVIVLLIFTFLVSLASVIGIQASFDYDKLLKTQKDRLTYLQEEYYNDDYEMINDFDFCSFSSYDTRDMRLNEVQYLATHNSYKQPINKPAGFFFDTFGKSFGVKKDEFTYGEKTITNQLNSGIRSFELDVIEVKKGDDISFLCCHSPIFDMNSTCIDFERALMEIRLWMVKNPFHLPISIIIESKSDELVFPNSKKMDMEGLSELDKIVENTFGYRLTSPYDVLGNYENFQEMRENNGWPKMRFKLGSIMVVYHKSNLSYDYINQDTTFSTQNMFPALTYDDLENYNQYASVLLMNNPYDENIPIAIDNNFIVRTRINNYQKFGDGSKEIGIASGAQILSTDYPPFEGATENDKVTYLSENYTMIRRENNN